MTSLRYLLLLLSFIIVLSGCTPAKAPNIQEYYRSIDFSCNLDSDCEIQDIHNGCGYYPACTNKDANISIDLFEEIAQREGLAGECGWPSLDSCKCVDNYCIPFYKERRVKGGLYCAMSLIPCNVTETGSTEQPSLISNASEFKLRNEGLVRLHVGESVLGNFVTLIRINTDSVTLHLKHVSVECGSLDKYYNLTEEETQFHGIGMSLFKVEQDSAILKIKSYPTFC